MYFWSMPRRNIEKEEWNDRDSLVPVSPSLVTRTVESVMCFVHDKLS